MLRLPIRSMSALILFVAFWTILGSNDVSAVGNTEELKAKVEIVRVDHELDNVMKDSVSLVVIAVVKNDNKKDVSVTLRIDVLNTKNKVIKSDVMKNKLDTLSQAAWPSKIDVPLEDISVPINDKSFKVRGKILEVKEAT